MRRILIMGGTQFFGKRLVQQLIDNGDKVTIATRGKTEDHFGSAVDRLIIEREQRNTLELAFSNKSWDVVYDQTCYSPIEALDALEALDGRIGKYVFTSTGAVYDYGSMVREEGFDPYNYRILEKKTRREYQGFEGYQQLKRTSEAILYQRASCAVTSARFSIVIGPDDFTNRFKFYVDHVVNQTPIGIMNPDARVGFISSDEAAFFLKWVGENPIDGPFNATTYGDISHLELLTMIEEKVGKRAIILKETGDEDRSPYSFIDSWSMDSTKAIEKGFAFTSLKELVNRMIDYYIGDTRRQKNI